MTKWMILIVFIYWVQWNSAKKSYSPHAMFSPRAPQFTETWCRYAKLLEVKTTLFLCGCGLRQKSCKYRKADIAVCDELLGGRWQPAHLSHLHPPPRADLTWQRAVTGQKGVRIWKTIPTTPEMSIRRMDTNSGIEKSTPEFPYTQYQ